MHERDGWTDGRTRCHSKGRASRRRAGKTDAYRPTTNNVDSKWNAMKEVWQKATEQVCGWTKGPPRHSETWWWNREVGYS